LLPFSYPQFFGAIPCHQGLLGKYQIGHATAVLKTCVISGQ
jgi:hypothetical protein